MTSIGAGSSGILRDETAFNELNTQFKNAKTTQAKVEILGKMGDEALANNGHLSAQEKATLNEAMTSMGAKLTSSNFHPDDPRIATLFSNVKEGQAATTQVNTQAQAAANKADPTLKPVATTVANVTQATADKTKVVLGAVVSKPVYNVVKQGYHGFMTFCRDIGVNKPQRAAKTAAVAKQQLTQALAVSTLDPMNDNTCVKRALSDIGKNISPPPKTPWNLPSGSQDINRQTLKEMTHQEWTHIDPKNTPGAMLELKLKGQEGKAIIEIGAHAFVYEGISKDGKTIKYSDPSKPGVQISIDKSKIGSIYKMGKEQGNSSEREYSYMSPKDMKPIQVEGGKIESPQSSGVRKLNAIIMDPKMGKDGAELISLIKNSGNSNASGVTAFAELKEKLSAKGIKISDNELKAIVMEYNAKTEPNPNFGGATSIAGILEYAHKVPANHVFGVVPAHKDDNGKMIPEHKILRDEALTNLMTALQHNPMSMENHSSTFGATIQDKSKSDQATIYDMMMGKKGC